MLEVLHRLLGLLSHRAMIKLGRLSGWLWFNVVRFRRRLLLDQLQRSFPEWDAAKVKQVGAENLKQLCTTFAEAGLLHQLQPGTVPSFYSEDGMDKFRAALASGRGVVVITAHIGNWELFAVLQALAGTKLTVVVRHIKNQSLDRMWNRVRTRFGLSVLFAKRRMGAMKEMLSALRRGEALALVIDQNMPRDKGVFVEFFGRPANTMDLPALLQQRTHCIVIPAFMIRTTDSQGQVGHKVIVLDPIEASPDDDRVSLTQRYTKAVEDIVRRYPEQWLWVHRRWKVQPQ